MVKKRGLGKGLDALIGSSAKQNKATTHTDETSSTLPINDLQRGQYQPRQSMAEAPLDELAESIKAQGIIQPIVVRPMASGNYEIIAGERRWQAAKRAGLAEVPVVVREISDRDAIAMALIENIQRENLTPLEEAQALERLIAEFSLTQQQAADAVGKSRPMVANLLRLLGLPVGVKDLLAAGKLEMGHARALLAAESTQQLPFAKQVVAQGLSVRETEKLVQSAGEKKPVKTAKQTSLDPNTQKLQTDLEDTLGAKVSIKTSGKQKGSVTIYYNSLDELDGILEHIK